MDRDELDQLLGLAIDFLELENTPDTEKFISKVREYADE